MKDLELVEISPVILAQLWVNLVSQNRVEDFHNFAKFNLFDQTYSVLGCHITGSLALLIIGNIEPLIKLLLWTGGGITQIVTYTKDDTVINGVTVSVPQWLLVEFQITDDTSAEGQAEKESL